MLDKLSGSYYVAEHSSIITQLNAVNKPALVGIQREDGIYTIIGPKNVYYSTPSGTEGEIDIGDLLNVLKENAWQLGKTATCEFITLNDTDNI